MVVQETRWSLNSEWTTGHHHIIHSSSGTRKDGLMVMIEKTFVLSSQAIRSSAIIPGRVLQLRLDQNRVFTSLLYINMSGTIRQLILIA